MAHSELKILHLTTSLNGGAGVAALRIQQSQLAAGMRSTGFSADSHGHEGWRQPGRAHDFARRAAYKVDTRFERLEITGGDDRGFISSSSLGSSRFLSKEIQACDIVNLHWMNSGFFSVGAIGRISKPVVWTLHDEWPFHGVLHYADPKNPDRSLREPIADSRNKSHRGLDLERHFWKRKMRLWQNFKPVIVGPSNWMADRARRSEIFKGCPVHVVPYPIDLELFSPNPIKDRDVRSHSKSTGFRLLCGAVDLNDPRKGCDLLHESLSKFNALPMSSPSQLVLYGHDSGFNWPLETESLGYLSDAAQVAEACRNADVFLCPSRADNLPNTVVEAISCGLPVVAYRVGGLPDMVHHKWNGYLADPNDPSDFAEGIRWVLADHGRKLELGRHSRELVEKRHDPRTVAEKYAEIYAGCLTS